MDEMIVAQLLDSFKRMYGAKITSAGTLWEKQQCLLEFTMVTARKLENKVFEQAGTGYRGAIVEREGKRYRFVGYRATSIHGLFGMIRYRRAYYRCLEEGGGGWFPLDEELGIEKQHTPGLQYILSGFTAREVYQGSLDWFHEIFRPDGEDLISMRKALDMNYELGEKLEGKRQREIEVVHTEAGELQEHRALRGTVAVSIDATKVREKLGEEATDEGEKRYEIGFKDVKVAAVSEVFWESKRKEAYCSNQL